jgi:hypothetical protein
MEDSPPNRRSPTVPKHGRAPANRSDAVVTTYVPRSRARVWVAILGLWALVATVGLAWEVLRREGPSEAAPSRSAVLIQTAPVAKPVSPVPLEAPEPPRPTYVSTVPPTFRGEWDELTLDGCAGREARYTIGEHSFAEFEVRWDVTKVKVYSPTEIEIFTTTKDENASQVDAVWGFRLSDGGKTLTGRKEGGSFFRRCQS